MIFTELIRNKEVTKDCPYKKAKI